MAKSTVPVFVWGFHTPIKIFPAPIAEHRHGPFNLIADDAVIHAVLIDGPGMNFGKAVSGNESHRVHDLRVVRRRNAGIIPPVETVSDVAAIAQTDMLLEHCRLGPKSNSTVHSSIDSVDVSNNDGGTAIVMLSKCEVYWRHRYPIVRNREIELNAERRPSSAVGDRCLFNGGISVKHRLAGDFVNAGIEVAANVGQYGALQVFILKKDRAPVLINSPAGQIVAQGVRVVEAIGSELVEGRVGIGSPSS